MPPVAVYIIYIATPSVPILGSMINRTRAPTHRSIMIKLGLQIKNWCLLCVYLLGFIKTKGVSQEWLAPWSF